MKKILKWSCLGLLAAIVITNLPFINTNFMILFDGNEYFRYSNTNASCTIADNIGFKNGSLTPTVMDFFNQEKNPTPENRELFRLYRINPFCFWRWSYYIAISSNFRYKSWKEIEPNRAPYNPEDRWQDF